MKGRLLFILTIFGMIGFVLVVTVTDKADFKKRYHQHEEWNSEVQIELEISDIKTHLPVIQIDTAGQQIPGERIIGTDAYQLTEDGESEIETTFKLYQDESAPLTLVSTIHYRGNSSRLFRKKSYSLGFIDQNKNEKAVSLLGMEADNNWALHGPYLDRSLIRNYLAMNVAGEIMPYAPDVRFVEVFIDENYEGLYLLMEKVTKGDGRVSLTTPENNSRQTSYIVVVDRLNKMNFSLNEFLRYTDKSYPSGTELIYPTGRKYTEERQQYVERDFSYIAHSIYQIPYGQEDDHYQDLLDVQAFYDYFILNELFRNVDAGRYSTYFYRDMRGKLTPVVWDFNNSLNNYQSTTFDETGFSMTQSIFYEQLLKDDDFVDGLIQRYYELRKTKLKTQRLHQYIDETVNFLGDSITRNNERWSDMYDLTQYDTDNYLQPIERNVTSYHEAIQQLKQYLEKRAEWLDDYIETLHQYDHPSRHSHESIK
ncbi:CotH kinase family protein [Ornithinibacillus californiensis]|uniref:CotH kinase family protein n=1 Tax=Ornithinibacillus californiensis TaxID=161536 RepID=UPI00064E006D|nr:CotH kinase family protein [Ornithinibacillus californiensis]